MNQKVLAEAAQVKAHGFAVGSRRRRKAANQEQRRATSQPISAAYSQAEVQALRDKCEQLADEVRVLSVLVHALRTELVGAGVVKGGA